MNPRVKTVKPIINFQLLIGFENGEIRIFDVNPYLDKGIFKELKSVEVFNSATVVDGTVQWSNKADLCPDTLYVDGVIVNPLGH